MAQAYITVRTAVARMRALHRHWNALEDSLHQSKRAGLQHTDVFACLSKAQDEISQAQQVLYMLVEQQYGEATALAVMEEADNYTPWQGA
jgi:hypothetical protein